MMPGRKMYAERKGIASKAFSVLPFTRAHITRPRSVLSAPETCMKGHPRIELEKCLCRGNRESVGDSSVDVFGYSGQTHAETEKAGVERGRFVFDCREIEKILVHDSAEFLMMLCGGGSDDRDSALHVCVA